MPIEFKNDCAFFLDAVSVEDAEGLLEWLQRSPSAKVDLAGCCHMHTANLQVLMAAKPTISSWPEDAKLSAWLETVLPLSADMNKQDPPEPNRRKSKRVLASSKGRVRGAIPGNDLEPASQGATHGNDNSRRR
jgi:hypothetical protein